MPNSNFWLSVQPLTQFPQESQQHPPVLTSQEEALLSHKKKLPHISEHKDNVIWEGEEKGDAKMGGWKMRDGCFGDWNISRSTFVYINWIHSPNWIHYTRKVADNLQQNTNTAKLSGKSLQQLKPEHKQSVRLSPTWCRERAGSTDWQAKQCSSSDLRSH